MQRAILPHRALPVVCMLALSLLHAFACAAEPRPEPTAALQFEQTPLVDALDRLGKASGLQITFADDVAKDAIERARPVTLAANDQPVDEVLYEILRERGLVPIKTGEKTREIVPERPLGMVKRGGHALRTLSELAQLADHAEWRDGDIYVPGWRDQDDRRLLEALVDYWSAQRYFDVLGKEGSGELDLASYPKMDELISCFDPDVPGFAAFAFSRWATASTRENSDRLKEIRGRFAQLAGPLAKALNLWRNRSGLAAMGLDLKALTKDVSWEERYALAARGGFESLRAADDVRAVLLEDQSAMIRARAFESDFASRFWRQDIRAETGGHVRFLGPYLRRIRKEPDPLAAACMVLAAVAPWYRQSMDPSVPAAAAASAGIGQDDWLSLVLQTADKTFGPFGGCARRAEEGASLAAVEAMKSDKVSRRWLGLMTIAAVCQMNASCGPGIEKFSMMDLSSLVGLSDASNDWQRVAGIVAAGQTDSREARRRHVAALESDEMLDRAAALLSCTLDSRFNHGVDLSNQQKRLVMGLLDAPAFCERALAVEAAAARFSEDELQPLLKDWLTQQPDDVRTMLLLREVKRRSKLPFFIMRECASLVFGKDDLCLQMLYLRCCGMSEEVIARLPAETLALALDDLRFEWHFRLQRFGEKILQRLEVLSRTMKADTRGWLADALATFGAISKRHLDADQEQRLVKCAERVLPVCLSEKASEEDIRRGFRMLEMLIKGNGPLHFPGGQKWDWLPEAVRDAILGALRLADDPVHRPAVARLIEPFFGSYTGAIARLDNPEFNEAVLKAGQAIMEQGTFGEKLLIMTEKPFATELTPELLQLMMNEGGLTDDECGIILHKLTEPEIPEGISEHLLKVVADRQRSYEIRSKALFSLCSSPDALLPLLEVLYKLADEESGNSYLLCGNLACNFQPIMHRILDEEQKRLFREKAAQLGLAVARNPYHAYTGRSSALSLYVQATGAEAKEVVLQFIFGEEDPRLRSGAWKSFRKSAPETTIYRDLAERYSDLRWLSRVVIAEDAVEAKEAEGAQGFLASYFGDPEIPPMRKQQIAEQLKEPLEPALKQVLDEYRRLEADQREAGQQ